MKLANWLTRNGYTITRFADESGVSRSHISRLLSGDRTPSMAVAAQIAVATKGAVTADDWMRVRPRETAGNVAA